MSSCLTMYQSHLQRLWRSLWNFCADEMGAYLWRPGLGLCPYVYEMVLTYSLLWGTDSVFGNHSSCPSLCPMLTIHLWHYIFIFSSLKSGQMKAYIRHPCVIYSCQHISLLWTFSSFQWVFPWLCRNFVLISWNPVCKALGFLPELQELLPGMSCPCTYLELFLLVFPQLFQSFRS